MKRDCQLETVFGPYCSVLCGVFSCQSLSRDGLVHMLSLAPKLECLTSRHMPVGM